jgi:hypothetical protein
MATTLDAVVKLNSDRKAVRSAQIRSVEKELLQLLRSAPKHFQSRTPLSAKQLLNRFSLANFRLLIVACHVYTTNFLRLQNHLWIDYDMCYVSLERNMLLGLV